MRIEAGRARSIRVAGADGARKTAGTMAGKTATLEVVDAEGVARSVAGVRF